MTTGVDDNAWIDISNQYMEIIAPGNKTSASSGLNYIGFDFTLGSTTHTKFSTNINGTVRLGNTAINASGSYNQPLGSNHTNGPKIEPFGRHGRFDSTCYTRVALIGDSGSRVLAIETRMKDYNSNNDSVYVSFQVQLFESGGLRIVYGESDSNALRGTTQNGVVAATSANRDIIFIDFATHETARFAGNNGYCTLTNNVWPVQGRWYELMPDSNACPTPANVTMASTDTNGIRLQRSSFLADLRLRIPAVGIDTLWPQMQPYMELDWIFNPRTTYSGTAQSECNGGHMSYRTSTFSFTSGCGEVMYLPWTEDFSSSSCWNTDQSAEAETQWITYSGAMYCRPDYGGGHNDWLISPVINLPDDEGLTLRWMYKATQFNLMAPTVDVRIAPCAAVGTVDSLQWITVKTLDTIYNNYTEQILSLDNWQGQRIRIAFVRTGMEGRHCFIDDVTVQQELLPSLSLAAPQVAYVDDTTVLSCQMSGIADGAQWEWHSTLLNDWSTDSGQWTIVYTENGTDTVTLIVTNAYGADTATAIIRVADCSVEIPWVETFDSTQYGDCWTIDGWNKSSSHLGFPDEHGVRQTYNSIMQCASNNKYMITPAIAIPSTGVENLKLWVECVASNLEVKLSTTANTDPNDFNVTLMSVNQPNNSNLRYMGWYLADLAPYAGDTVRIGFFHSTNTPDYICTVKIDYDLLPVLGNIEGCDTTNADSVAVFTVPLLRGVTNSLTYWWESSLGGAIATNTRGDTMSITYYTGGVDTITVIAYNAFGNDTMTKVVHVVECQPVTALPWTETFADGIWCWHRPAGSGWQSNPGQSLSYIWSADDTTYRDSWIISPEIYIPADVNECTRFFWKIAQSSSAAAQHYEVMVSQNYDYTDLSEYISIYEDSSIHPTIAWNDNYDYLSANLTPFAGQTIHIAFRHHPRNNQTYRALYILEAEVRSAKVPVLTGIDVPEEIYTEDGPGSAAALLSEGHPNGLTYMWYSPLMDTTIVTTSNTVALPYNTDGTDTLRVVASNVYGSDTAYAIVHVHHCLPISLPLVENFKSESTLGCWRMWNFSPDNDWAGWRVEDHITSGYNVICAGTYYDEANYWLVSPELDIATDGVNLRVKVYGGSSASSNAYLTILASTTGIGDTANFTDTLYHAAHYTSWEDIIVPLNNYAGQHVRLAFVHTGSSYYSYGMCLDSLNIYYEYIPQVTVTHNSAQIGFATVYRASINNCVSTGLQYRWHSTLTGASVTSATADSLVLTYTTVGIDTVTLIVSNTYGADTVTTVVDVTDCMVRTLPYSEDFEGVGEIIPSFAVEGVLPDCWESIWTGSANMAPRIINPNGYQFIANLPDNAVIMLAGNSQGYSTESYVVLPPFAESLQNLYIAFDHRHESATIGALAVGYIDRYGNFTVVQDSLTPNASSYRRDTVSFANIGVTDGQIALRWSYGQVYYAVVIDNVEVFSDSTRLLLPQVTLDAPEEVEITDIVVYTAHVRVWDTTGLTYTWHSTLLDTTWGPWHDSTLSFVYRIGGHDTITVTVANAYGSSSAQAIVWVSDCGHKPLPFFEDFNDTESLSSIGFFEDGTRIYDVPTCWIDPWSGSYILRCYITPQPEGTNDSTNKIKMYSGTSYNTTNYVVLPGFDNGLNTLAMALDYIPHERGTLSVGYIVGETYTPVQELTNQATLNNALNMYRDTVYFSGITAPADARMAIHYSNSVGIWDFVLVDNVEVFEDTNSHLGIANHQLPNTDYPISIYPNPASTTVTVKVDMPMHVALMDVSGRIVITQAGNKETTLDVSGMPAGTYFLRVTTEEGCEIKKLIIK